MSSEPKPTKSSRSKSGCVTCRARKIRCDERPGVCLNCDRLGLPCTGAAGSPAAQGSPPERDASRSPASAAAPSRKRKRTFRSCVNCRSTKTRCSGDQPACARCKEKGLQCVYEDNSEPAWRQQLRFSLGQPSPGSNGEGNGPGDSARGSARPEAQEQKETPPGSWLESWHLPPNYRVRMLVERYFTNIHPLRCFGFLHKPSFIQRLDTVDTRGCEDDALLLIVCSLGALFYAIEHQPTDPPKKILAAGSQWAKRSQQLILAQLNSISVENLMAAILLHEYELRMANFGNAFMLSGLTARMAQALQINLEHSTDILCQDTQSGPGASTKESRRRLMWCCYVSDSLIGNGIDQLTLIKETDIKIQLPCTERNFVLQAPCITEVLEPGQFLKFITPESLPSYPRDNMGIRAYYLRYIAIRRRVLKYIKHLDVAQMPWLPHSEFAQLDAESRAWYESLPESLQFTPSSVYIRRETTQLGALCALHWMYHLNMCDLYRIGAPTLYKLRNAFVYPPEQADFQHHLQDELFGHARKVGIIAAEAFRNGPHALADSWAPTVVYECCRVMLFYLTQLIDPAAENSQVLLAETIPLIRTNVKALKMMKSMYAVADLLTTASERLLGKVGFGTDASQSGQSNGADEPYELGESDDEENSVEGTPIQSAPDYVLAPLSIYRMARKGIPEKHAPERQRNPIPGAAPGRLSLQRRSTLQHVATYGPDQIQSESAGGESYGAQQQQPGFDDLLSLFTSDPAGGTWQPLETAIASQQSNGVPPWEPTYSEQPLDAWVPMFSSTQHFG